MQQPPYAPELNPAEQVFEDLRQHCAGCPYATIEEKVAVMEQPMHELVVAPERVKHLTGRWPLHRQLVLVAAGGVSCRNSGV